MKKKKEIIITFTPELLDEWTEIYMKKNTQEQKIIQNEIQEINNTL